MQGKVQVGGGLLAITWGGAVCRPGLREACCRHSRDSSALARSLTCSSPRAHSVDPPLDSRSIDRASPLRGEGVLVRVLFWTILFPSTREISSGGDEPLHVRCALLSVVDCVLCLFLRNEFSNIELNSVWWLGWTLNLLSNIPVKFTVISSLGT
jgi:hypothetical protein